MDLCCPHHNRDAEQPLNPKNSPMLSLYNHLRIGPPSLVLSLESHGITQDAAFETGCFTRMMPLRAPDSHFALAVCLPKHSAIPVGMGPSYCSSWTTELGEALHPSGAEPWVCQGRALRQVGEEGQVDSKNKQTEKPGGLALQI